MSPLFEFLERNHNPNLEFIDSSTGERVKWDDIVNNLPGFFSRKKELAFLYLDNSFESVRMLLAFIKSNHAVCLLGSSLNIEFKKRLEAIYKPAYIVDTLRNDIGNNIEFDGVGMKVYKQEEYESHIHPDIKILLSTSGTTGSPRFVKLTDNNFIANTQSIIEYLPVSGSDVCALNLPIYYSYGLSVLFTNIARGGKIICTNESVLSRGFRTMFEKYKCTTLSGVPYTYEMLLRSGFVKQKYPSLKYITQAGGKLNEKTLKIFADYCKHNNIEFFVMYGQTEATARMSYLPPAKLTNKLGSVGRPVKDGKFRIETGTNELIYSGPNVGCGYAASLNDLEKCDPLKELRTGDIASVDNDGDYYIIGRLNRFVKLFGSRISLDEVENDLNKKYGCFIGCTGLDEKILLLFSTNKNIDSEDIRSYVSIYYKLHISVIKYLFTEDIPLTGNQKVNYQSVIESYLSGQDV
ncbi:MAG: AMP-binding protein [Bacteroidia bacterium]